MTESNKMRLDRALVARALVATRSQAENYVRLGEVQVNGVVAAKPGQPVAGTDDVVLTVKELYVNRAALKLASVAAALKLDFRGKVVLDVGSSTGGFTEYALRHGAQKVIAVDVGTDQLHPSLRVDPRVALYEQTDIRDMRLRSQAIQLANSLRVSQEPRGRAVVQIDSAPDLIVADVSFISLREILPHVSRLMTRDSRLVAMVKPQFEVGAHTATGLGFRAKVLNKGVVKNDKMRRDILKDFEAWAAQYFMILDKADSQIAGSKGNIERFYLLRKI